MSSETATPKRTDHARETVRRLGVLLTAAAALISPGCGEKPKPTAGTPVPVKVAPVIQRDVPIYREWIGTTVGYVTAQIRPRVSGYLLSQDYREGTPVKTGDLLFRIDPRQYQNALDQARGKLQQSQAQLAQARSQLAQLQYEQGVIKAFQEVSSSLVALDELAGAEAELARSVKALEKAVDLARIRYLYGLSSYFEVLEAEERLFPAQNAQAAARLNRLLAYVGLYKALGGGWNVTDPGRWSGP